MLSMTSQYALRALAYIAAHDGDESVLGRQISKDTGIPKNYLSKILTGLSNAGIVSASRGTGGGYRLAEGADGIMLERVVAVFDRDIVNPCCLLGFNRPCSDNNACSAHFVWKATRAALVEFLHGTSLADISSRTPMNPAKPSPAVSERGGGVRGGTRVRARAGRGGRR
jgi:Rrf2 family protein